MAEERLLAEQQHMAEERLAAEQQHMAEEQLVAEQQHMAEEQLVAEEQQVEGEQQHMEVVLDQLVTVNGSGRAQTSHHFPSNYILR